MGRSRARLPDTGGGHESRLRRVQLRTEQVFGSPLARDPAVTMMGTQIRFRVRTSDSTLEWLEMAAPDVVQVGHLAMVARPFTLRSEQIYFERVVESLLWFATTEAQRRMAMQLTALWKRVPVARLLFYAADGTGELIPGGATDGQVGDRVLYSQLVHADDASDLLDHIEDDAQLWSLAGMVGDWVAIIAHQQHVLRMVRPDLCTELVAWPGDPKTVFRRFGAEVRETTSETGTW